jgi:2-keto-4-pentenoate hydratase
VEGHERFAEALLGATRERSPIRPLTDAEPDMTVLDAYRIQQLVVKARLPEEGPVAGYKVGLTSRAMQELLGIDQPDFAPILSSTLLTGDATLRRDDFISPRVEAEIAFLLRDELRGPGVEPEDVLAATVGVMAAIEVIDSRIEGWRIRLPDTIADMASSAMVIVSGRPVPVEGLLIEDLACVMQVDGAEVGRGEGRAVLGHPARAVAWLANTLGGLGVALEAGQIVMPGAMHAAVNAEVGHRYQTVFDRLGTVQAAFE